MLRHLRDQRTQLSLQLLSTHLEHFALLALLSCLRRLRGELSLQFLNPLLQRVT